MIVAYSWLLAIATWCARHPRRALAIVAIVAIVAVLDMNI